jgi:hypothetical protein
MRALVLVFGLACSRHEAAEIKADGGPTQFAAAQAELRKFVAPGADLAALTRALRPTSADYAAVFGSDGPKAEAHYAKLWSDLVIAPKTGESEVIVFSETSDELIAAHENAHLVRGVMVYRWKFVEPGKTLGMTFDGLVFANGHFVFFPEPWKATE